MPPNYPVKVGDCVYIGGSEYAQATKKSFPGLVSQRLKVTATGRDYITVETPGGNALDLAHNEYYLARDCVPKPKLTNDLSETIIVDPVTGGEKGSKLARFDLIPSGPLQLLAEHYGRGARKYADRNWEKGYKWGLSFAAMMRHAWAFWRGEDIDAETGSPHLVAVAWHAFALLEFWAKKKGTDDRGETVEKT